MPGVREKEFEKVLNRFSRNKKDLVTPKDVKKIEERYDIEHRTNKINRLDAKQDKKGVNEQKIDKSKNLSELSKQETPHYKALDFATPSYEVMDSRKEDFNTEIAQRDLRNEEMQKTPNADASIKLPHWMEAAYDKPEEEAPKAPLPPNDIDD